ncbi:unnamed protein product [Brachionus calyciflorus]|uniref:Uncharacterized protein n=1 Tax=Brachionus calyciflorus TaxID=104777 RepID=A0A813SSZ8_9BILA|nr:unnamed protein product [Brachionus calyciflorus]
MSSTNTKRFHPYSQNQINPTLNTPNRPTTSKQIQNTPSTNFTFKTNSKSTITNENYEHQNYLNSLKQKSVYPTLLKTPNTQANKKGILKDRSNLQEQQTEVKDDPKSLKIWSVTTKSMQIYANRFDIMQQNSTSKNGNSPIGNYLFEIIGQLDSTISHDPDSGAREFSLKDTTGRIHCVFFEIDRPLERFVRDSWIRCVGKFNTKKKLFQCVTLRLVKNECELISFGFQVNQTNSFLKLKYFK